MKGLLLTISILFCLLSNTTQAQTGFRQKKTQRKYLVRQIALLRVYLDYLKDGYEIANKGLTAIHSIKNGDFNLHRNFFGSLKNVNPYIANSAKVADIIAFQMYVIRDLRNVNNFCKNNEHFTPEEIRHVTSVYSNMLFLTDASISELLMIIRSNRIESDNYQMKDDERMMRIDKLYEDMLDKYAFVQSFNSDVRLIAKEREREQRSIEMLRKQHDII